MALRLMSPGGLDRPLDTEDSMHAALVTLTVDPVHAPAAAAALTNDILPMIRSVPGFVAGYWRGTR